LGIRSLVPAVTVSGWQTVMQQNSIETLSFGFLTSLVLMQILILSSFFTHYQVSTRHTFNFADSLSLKHSLSSQFSFSSSTSRRYIILRING